MLSAIIAFCTMEFSTGIILLGIVFLTILLILTLLVLIWHSGLLEDVNVRAGAPPYKQLNVMYKFGHGPYKDAGFIFTEVTSIAPQNKCFGIYYDDPKQVAPEKLRWAVGCIISEGQEQINTDLMAALEKEHYKRYILPAVNNAVWTSFPYRSQLSVLVGMYRVYPQMAAYIMEMKLCAHPFIEVYAGDVIHYYVPLSKQEYFYVPECDPEYQLLLNEASTIPHAPSQTRDKYVELEVRKRSVSNIQISDKDQRSMAAVGPDGKAKLNNCIEPEHDQMVKNQENPSESSGELSEMSPEVAAISNQGENCVCGTSAASKSALEDPAGENVEQSKVANPIWDAAAPSNKHELSASINLTKNNEAQASAEESVSNEKVNNTESGNSTKVSQTVQDLHVTRTASMSDDESISDVESSPVSSFISANLSSTASYSLSGTSSSSRCTQSEYSCHGASGDTSESACASPSGHLQGADKNPLADLSSDSDGEPQLVLSSSIQHSDM